MKKNPAIPQRTAGDEKIKKSGKQHIERAKRISALQTSLKKCFVYLEIVSGSFIHSPVDKK